MKKNISLYLISWAVVLAVFNVIAFIIPAFPEQNKFDASFWIGYSLITLSLIGQLICSITCLLEKNANKKFYNLSVITTSYIGLIVSFIVGGVCIIVSAIPGWVGGVICSLVLGANIILLIAASATTDNISSIEKKIKVQTIFIKSLTVDADTLVAKAKSDEAKAVCKKVYETIRYSDPMSNDALAAIESQITLKFAQLSDAVDKGDDSKTAEISDELLILINDRNKKCMLLK